MNISISLTQFDLFQTSIWMNNEAGHTWRSMDDGTIMWWNGTDWQQV